ncbi:MAG: twin-arginine translocase subunit TatC [Chloroflexi bacterium]|nr:MAG: twin-arginine translocase subunit TatC [Chloroflexota bacterium]MBL1193548.1 twin-arginine translocase subunit TatC [Chloroflexota bacterium]NOH10839.1 twin-arginine translocase subunit TatC [Chloroflexota bacterium]
MKYVLRTTWQIITYPVRVTFSIIKTILTPFLRLFQGLREFFGEEPEDVPIGDSIQRAAENPSDILIHLDALRRHLMRSVIVLTVACAIAFTFVTPIMDFLAEPIGGIDSLQAIEVTEPVGVVMRVTLLSGFSISIPYISLELLLFAAPGLSRKARFIGLFAIPLVFIFFVSGMAFAYFFILPTALPVLLNFMGIPTLPRPSSYLSFVTGLLFWIGISFEAPLLSYVLSAMGILKAEMLRNQWRIAIVIMAIFAAAVTPTVDPINMMLVLIPLVVLYLVSIIMAYIAQGRRLLQRSA